MKHTLGLYFHIPFCLSKCRYCDFCSFPHTEASLRARYVEALISEIEASADDFHAYTVDTVFFGGGTPTLLSADAWRLLTDAVRRHFSVSSDAEWTAEANPATADKEKLDVMRKCGINRLSIGMQSANDRELAALGRAHRHADLLRTVKEAREVGFKNINLDLMLGIPLQTKESFAASLAEAMALDPTHLSVYSLQIEEGTPFFEKRHTLPLPSEEEESAMVEHLLEKTAKSGFMRYEISNYAREGYACRHNLRYWRMQDYLGFGIAAHSLIGNRRFYNGEDIEAYLASPTGVRCEEELLTPAEREYETVMLGLRLGEGIDERDFRARFGYGFCEKYGERLSSFIKAGLVACTEEKTALTARGMALSNTILAEIL